MSGITRYEIVNLIDIAPTKDKPSNALINSMGESLDSPPMLVVVEDEKFKYRVVFGRRRINVLRDKGVTREAFLVVDSLDPVDYHVVAMRENAGTENIADEVDHVKSLTGLALSRRDICTKTGYTYWRVRNRQELGERLHPWALLALREGRINKSCANTLMKLTKDEQKALIEEHNGSPKVKHVIEAARNKKIDRLTSFSFLDEPDPEIKPGLFITPDDMEKVLTGEGVVRGFGDQKIYIGLTPTKKID